MSLILQIETATTSCSVALAKDGKVLSSRTINQRNIHAEVITVFIGEILAENGIGFQELNAVAVSSGPGSYTGLRIGVSTAKGLCFSLDKPLIAVETLQAMAAGYLARFPKPAVNEFLLCPMIDARRMEVYTALFDQNLKQIQATSAAIINQESFSEILNQHQIIFFGDGAPKCKTILGTHPNAVFIGDFFNDAADLTQTAAAKFELQAFEDVAYFEPFYLKDFIAVKINS
ncbi:tRNA (adenosine(37)-N6)-threonylcarbamoyltransferase complex dimerization subunit type 1 TsaB [Mucilaginibacter arboris]|uniref:tRNA (Adenosine(37)-N6)-threonylcarbamoyltransferase complex dimerization subunit type 1 TsaB n=1 Tax=Mucilaginibacter arboris TaxID=2682090 RepID=A0A7K1SXI1_9SPHI|nr:tRNA (adenosine(37)-N6)-threonylcarbamoyltransferase complex dimerization subunit type 1 TsaB [Mucilaginibacter arboris]MVN21947.1 tRNA (adenosine(37)-N6)-threonylcarbamoyltransferase complex dimerization subunit type 1 TsaB [Mucilaginibacter arboris]